MKPNTRSLRCAIVYAGQSLDRTTASLSRADIETARTDDPVTRARSLAIIVVAAAVLIVFTAAWIGEITSLGGSAELMLSAAHWA